MRVKVDPIRCEGYGRCADVLPDIFLIDEWGYAYIEGDGAIPDAQEELGREAVKSCPIDAVVQIS